MRSNEDGFQHREQGALKHSVFLTQIRSIGCADNADDELKRLRRNDTDGIPLLCALCASFVTFVVNLPIV